MILGFYLQTGRILLDTRELNSQLEQMEIEDFLVWYGVDYKTGTGASGPQLNVKECPSCGGNSWKVYIGAETGLGNCFHGDCEKTFNKYSFIKCLFNNSHKEAIKEIEKYSRELGWRPKKKKAPKRQSVTFMMPETEEISRGGIAYDYLIRRGFSEDDIDYFGWKYCKEGSIIFFNEKNEQCEQWFSKRLIFPVIDLNGKIVTFQGRDITDSADKKYKFPAGQPGTAKFLYNGNNVIGKSHIIICEGVMDVAATRFSIDRSPELEGCGVVGTFGKHLSKSKNNSDDQYGRILKLKNLGLEKVTFLWDGEPKAIKSAIEHAIALRGLGLNVSVATLPMGKDPNEVSTSVVIKSIKNAVVLTPLLTIKLKMQFINK